MAIKETTVEKFDIFSTRFESNCIALDTPDECGNFVGLDSDKVECEFALDMVISIENRRNVRIDQDGMYIITVGAER